MYFKYVLCISVVISTHDAFYERVFNTAFINFTSQLHHIVGDIFAF